MKKFSIKGFFKSLTDSEAIRWIAKNAKGQWFSISLLTFLNVLLAGASIVVSYMLKNVVNSATGVYGAEVATRMSNITFWGVMFALVVLAQFAMTILSNHLVFRITARLTIDMKTSLYDKILRKSYSQITKYHTGEMLNRLNNDVTTISNAITALIPGVVYTFAKLIGIFVVLFTIDPLFTVLFLAVGIFAFVITTIFKKKMKNYHKQIFETDGKVRSFMQETLSSLLVIKIFNAEDKVVESASDLQEINYKRKKKRNFISIATQCLFSLAFNAAYIFGLIYCAVKIANNDPVVTYGVLSQVLSLISQISVPIRSLTAIIPTYYGAIASAERIIEFENMDDEPVLNESNIDFNVLYENLDTIEFKDIVFKYDRDVIFNNTNLTVNKGDLIVMTGISGIGKSTLTKLLLGVFPLESGEIYLKLKDGSKILVDRNIRRLFSYVPQGNFLLSGTLRENIAFIKDDATDEEIWQAVHFACADFIHELPEGLDTVIGEKGLGLSEGQVQRVAIARAILSGAPVVLLDEATSALDEATELKLLQNIKTLSNKTCILISHKKAANAVCNKEVRIIDGKIVVIENNEKSKD
ncbi:MAG: ABC transporter ATP-binding protein [Clostridia bacterium]|nr:ABC transporter ATP-binding protein [Clostridia bacterium]